jgi:lysophospholipase L1-like esterase
VVRRRLIHASTVIALALTLWSAPAAQSRADRQWVATWGTAQQSFRAPAPTTPAPAPSPQATPSPSTATPRVGPQRRFPIPPTIPGLNNQTVRMIVRTSLGGDTVRVRLAHAFGAAAVTIGAAHIGIRDKESAIVAGSGRTLTFSGKPTTTLYGGQVLVSDPVALVVKPLSDLAVSLYLPGDTGPPTSHLFALRPTYISKDGNFAAAAAIGEPARVTESYYWLSGIDVLAPAGANAGTIVTFGDSITDGDQSTPDTIGMWPALLAARLQARAGTRQVGMVNAGISGNRLLGDNGSGLARLTLHAISVPGVKWITLLEGINDITAATRHLRNGGAPAGPAITADDLIAAYQQVIEIAHLHGIKVIGCTLTPYGESPVFTDQGEAIRQAANTWIRTSGAFDAVVDFDAATRDPRQPTRFRPEADSPDMLHPGDAGYRLMAEAFDLAIFETSAVRR